MGYEHLYRLLNLMVHHTTINLMVHHTISRAWSGSEEPQCTELIHISCICIGKVWHACDTINTLGPCPFKLLSTQVVRSDLLRRTAKHGYHTHLGVCCTIKNYRAWICYHSSHMLCWCMVNVYQIRDPINTLAYHSSKPQSTGYLLPDLGRTAR